MRLAFVDLCFSWPPNGGADVDLYQTMRHLQTAGHEVKLFVSALEHSWERGDFAPETLPFPAERRIFSFKELTPNALAAFFQQAVRAYAPDCVFICDGFFLKPHVMLALEDYPTVARYYAYELAYGPSLEMHAREGALLPSYFKEPERCRRETLQALKDKICNWRINFWAHEYLNAKAYGPQYHNLLVRAHASLDAAIVYNPRMEAYLEGNVNRIITMPGGVEIETYRHCPLPMSEKKIILMVGRAEDPVKGLRVLYEAGARMAEHREDFQIWVTHSDFSMCNNWFKPLGWHPQGRIRALYEQAYACVVPSLWEEPFGLVAVEAQAAGRPVVASRTGGLQLTTVEGETGFLVTPGDATALAQRLETLLDDPGLAQRMGTAARARAEQHYSWPRIIETHYLPLLEAVCR